MIGWWRILETDLWDRDYHDLVEPAYLQIGNDGCAEFAFGAVNVTAELEYGPSIARSSDDQMGPQPRTTA